MSKNKKNTSKINREEKVNREEMELDQAYQSLTGRKPQPGISRNSAIIIAVSAVLIVVSIVVVLIALFSNSFTYGQVEIGGISLAGKSRDEAKAELEKLAQVYADNSMAVVVMDEFILMSPDTVMTGLDVDKILKDAQNISAQGGKLDILSYLGLDETAIWQQLLPLEDKYGITPAKTQWQITGSDPDPNDPQDAGSKKLVVTMGVPDYGLDTQKLFQMILQGYRQQNFQVKMDCAIVEPEAPDLDEIYSLTCTDAQDATLDEKTFEIIPEVEGYGFDLEAAKVALESCDYGQTVEFPFVKMQPQVTAQQLEDDLYGDILGEYKTPHTNDDNRNTNLKLACEAINGLVLLPGETFSYNDTLGERTREKGYKPASSYVNGMTVDSVGGGICQVSSTLYYTCLLSDMEIVRRSPHSYVSSYIPNGLDAAVSWKSLDFKFKNSLSTPIRIEAWVEDGYVHIRICGKETRSYYVELYSVELSSEPYDVVYKDYPPDNEEGYTDGQIIVTPYTGCTVKSYKQLVDRETGKVIDKVFIAESTYKKRDKVICLILEPTTPAPTDPAPEPTPEATTGAEQ